MQQVEVFVVKLLKLSNDVITAIFLPEVVAWLDSIEILDYLVKRRLAFDLRQLEA